jgi:hypothetical protein
MDNNGGNNPPMPDSGSSNSGAYFSSTDHVSIPRPAIAGPPANTIEGPRHAAVKDDDLMGYAKDQFVFLKKYTWSTTMLPGTIIESIPITPLRSNNVISYASAIFNCWNGGMDYQVKLAGTGFHAGELGIARIPPNIDPASLKTVTELSNFETKYIDPKRLDAEVEGMVDQRPIAYHYMRDDFNNPDNIGGWIVIFVVLQLNTSSTGTNQVDLRVSVKARDDFRMFQVRPPNVPGLPVTDEAKWNDLFATTELHNHTLFSYPIDTMELSAQTTTSAAAVGLRNLDGNLFLDDTYTNVNEATGGLPISGIQFYATSTTNVIPVSNTSTQYNRQVSIVTNGGAKLFNPMHGSISMPLNYTLNSASAVTGAVANNFYTLYPYALANCTVTYPGVNAFVPINGESLVLFCYANNGTYDVAKMLTTTVLSALFKTGKYRIASNEAVICEVYSKTSGLPICFIKINYNGIITTNAQATLVKLDFRDLFTKFISYTQSSIPLPSLTQQMLLSLQSLRTQNLLARMERLHLGD